MRIKVMLFAQYREIVGQSQLTLDLAAGATVATAKEALEKNNPRLNLSGGMAAINEKLAHADAQLKDGDELAFLPPVSGGEADSLLELTTEALEPRLSDLIGWAVAPAYGAVVSFLGTTRSPNKEQRVRFLEYEAYGSMAQKSLAAIEEKLRRERPLGRIAIIHRLGRVHPAEASLLIVVSAAHRPEAFDAARQALEMIKKTLPVWKKEFLESGEVWVEGAVAEEYEL